MPRESRGGEALVALFLLGVVAFSPLLLDVFDPPAALVGSETATVLVLGVPPLFLYLFVVWAVLIVSFVLVVERGARTDAPERPSQPRSEVE